MKNKKIITEDNYKEIMLKRGIITCWSILAICLIITFCGGKYFEIACESKTFINVCNYLDTIWFRHILYYILYCFECYALIKIINPKITIRSKKFLIYIIIFSIDWIFKTLVDFKLIKLDETFSFILFMSITYTMLLLFSKNWWKPVLVMIYQILLVSGTTFIKSISFISKITSSFLHTTLFCIDYYSLLTLTILYVVLRYTKKIKEDDKNGSNK